MEYNLSSIVSDNAERTFEEAELFQSFLTEMDRDSKWIEVEKSNEMSVQLAGSPDDVIEGITDVTFNDTVIYGTKLLLNCNGESFYIGISALPTLKARAGITGPALEKVDREELANILNKCLPVSKGGTLVRICGDKVRACHSKNYKPLSQSGIFRTVRKEVEAYEGKEFTGGAWSHDFMSASWDINDSEVIKSYIDIFTDAGIPVEEEDIKTTISVNTSDVGTAGATIWYNVEAKKRTIVIGSGSKLNHKGSADLSEFSDCLKDMFASYRKKFYELEELKNIEIKHPVGCIYLLLKKADMPPKMANEAARRYMAEFGNAETDALMVYIFGVSEVLTIAKEAGVNLAKQLSYQEKVARVIGYNFKSFDKDCDITDL